MGIEVGLDEYAHALKQGQREVTELAARGRDTSPAVLDELLPENNADVVQDLGVLEIPSERIIGTKSAGRIVAFSPSFLPLLDPQSEFANKWANLCVAHLGEVGIREPISCFEYLGNFYVQEGNKRVSVLRYFGAPRIPAVVRRIVPPQDGTPRIQAYYEFLDFFKASRLYAVQFRRPNDYAKLLSAVGKHPGEPWTEDERRTFNAYFSYFRDAFSQLGPLKEDVLPEEALLLWLQLYTYKDLGRFTVSEIRKTLTAMRYDMLSAASHDSIKVQTTAETGKSGILSRLSTPVYLNVAFVHQLSPATSGWVLGHEQGRKYLEEKLGNKLTIRSYFNADTPQEASRLLEQAVSDGAQVVFTTAPLLRTATLKAAIEYPKVQFLNCSVDQPYSSVRSYYGRVYEGKFITGAIAGALAQNNRIGYIASYPIYGQLANINAFALGAQLTNPRARIELRWSCVEGDPQADFFANGIRVISNRDAPGQNKMYLDFCSYGTYLMDDNGELVPLGSPVWVWGKFYEYVLNGMFSGTWKSEKANGTALNYWLGMDSGVISVNLSDHLPEGLRALAEYLRTGLSTRTIDPFARRIVAQDGTVKNDGAKVFTPDELLHMDWLCDNILGSLPDPDEILPVSQAMVKELGIYQDGSFQKKEG